MSTQALTGFFTHIATDWVVLAAIIIIVAFDSMRSGPSRAIAIAIGFPLATLLFPWIGPTAILGGISTSMVGAIPQAILFGVLLMLLTFIAYRLVRSFDAPERPLQAVLSGAATAAIVMAMWLKMPALLALWHPGSQTSMIFGASYALLWVIAALFALAVARN